ncbi:MAG: nucleotidyltransferase family protein [Patescibacteria group bacterium]|nr:nucleotidyltransferase family protein [Patescibacteria group bacterium]MDE2438593.1 nucleotidyltransferase family protein [Patescibacteria group bacterium]
MDRVEELLGLLKANKSLQFIFEHAGDLNMPNWYVGAGGIAQTVWNIQHGFDPEYMIKDYDLVYYDAADTSFEGQEYYIQEGKRLFRE